MHKIRRIMRLSHEAGRSQREIARACRLSQPSVQRVLKRAREAGLAWPLPEELDEEALAARLYGERPQRTAARDAEPDFQAVRKQLKKYRHVTLERLWQEYREGCLEGYCYSHFCALYAPCQWAPKMAHGAPVPVEGAERPERGPGRWLAGVS